MIHSIDGTTAIKKFPEYYNQEIGSILKRIDSLENDNQHDELKSEIKMYADSKVNQMKTVLESKIDSIQIAIDELRKEIEILKNS